MRFSKLTNRDRPAGIGNCDFLEIDRHSDTFLNSRGDNSPLRITRRTELDDRDRAVLNRIGSAGENTSQDFAGLGLGPAGALDRFSRGFSSGPWNHTPGIYLQFLRNDQLPLEGRNPTIRRGREDQAKKIRRTPAHGGRWNLQRLPPGGRYRYPCK